MNTILLTGFEPFGGDSVNPSWEAVSSLPETIGENRLVKLLLPVVYGKSGEILRKKAEEISPDYLLAVGVAGGRKAVTPELLAVNYRMGAIPDNAGQRYEGEKIFPHGPDAIMTELPVKKMVEALRENGIPSSLSLSAGAYVCNDLYYHLLIGQKEGGYRGGFLHVPPADVMKIDQIADALQICIQTIIAERD